MDRIRALEAENARPAAERERRDNTLAAIRSNMRSLEVAAADPERAGAAEGDAVS